MSLQKINWLGFGGAGIPGALPRAVAELQGFTISGPLAGVGSNTLIQILGIEYYDTLLKALLFSSGVPSDVTSNVTIVDRRSSGTFTLSGVAAGDVVSVNGKTYTFVASAGFVGNYLPFQTPLGSTDGLSAARLATAIMSGDATLSASASNNVVTVVTRTMGASGNTIALSASASNGHVTASGSVLANGSDTQGIKLNTNTTGNSLVVFWYGKDLVSISPPAVVGLSD